MEFIWILFLLLMLQPVLRQKLLENSRQRLIGRLEKERGSRVILMVHRQETMGLLGFPIFRYIDVDDAEQVLRAIHLTDPSLPIDLVLHTPGGLVLPSMQIARALARREGEVRVLVPHMAMSGGTLIALAAARIIMTEHAVLGPVDPQLDGMPGVSLRKVVEHKPIERIDDRTLVLADQAEKAQVQICAAIKALCGPRLGDATAQTLADTLCAGSFTHDHPILVEDAKALGLPIETDMPEAVLDLMALYPQPTRHQPSVEYLPVPRGPEKKG
ncbi:MAG: ATP-dependent Clp protease proteolytic subunit [Planctomycetota bacterium]